MPGKINFPNKETRYIARSSDGSILHTGVTHSNQVTETGQEILETYEDVNEFLGAASSWASKFPDLPSPGEQVEEGQYYNNNGQVIIGRQTHIRTNHNPIDVPALFLVARAPGTGIEWIEQEQVYAGTEREYNGSLYKAIQKHVTQTGWEPPSVPALWELSVASDEGVWSPGLQVSVGEEYYYPDRNGTLYEVIQSHTTQAGWEPDRASSLWSEVTIPSSNIWEPGIAVSVGEEYWYPDEQGTLYTVVQSHTTQIGWEPPSVPALWSVA